MQKEILLLTQFQWHTTFGLSIPFKVVLCPKVRFQQENVRKDGIFEGSSCGSIRKIYFFC